MKTDAAWHAMRQAILDAWTPVLPPETMSRVRASAACLTYPALLGERLFAQRTLSQLAALLADDDPRRVVLTVLGDDLATQRRRATVDFADVLDRLPREPEELLWKVVPDAPHRDRQQRMGQFDRPLRDAEIRALRDAIRLVGFDMAKRVPGARLILEGDRNY